MDFSKFQGNVLSLVDKFTPETGKNARKKLKKTPEFLYIFIFIHFYFYTFLFLYIFTFWDNKVKFEIAYTLLDFLKGTSNFGAFF